jgi:membrane fusion protein, copper/silver efflux system
MTLRFRIRRVGVAILSALATAAVLSTALWAQQRRNAWPFAPRLQATSAPTTHDVAPPDPGTAADRVPIGVSASTVQDLGIRIEAVRRESLTHLVRAVATVVPDESRLSHVHTRVAGWVEQLDINTTGEAVQAGQPLARIFSQELLSSQTEYLSARRATAASGITSAVVASGRTRLSVLGMSPAEIDAIEESGEPTRLVTVVAPRRGVVVNRGITVGTSVDPSTTLLTIADLSRVWVLAEVSEADIPAVRIGSSAQLDFPASGRAPISAHVDFLYPTLTERTRTLRVRLSVANPNGTLRPGLYGTAALESAGAPTITIPRDAVVDTGRQQHVFVAVGDRLEPRLVTLGTQLAERVEVRSGLSDGDRVVSAGVFLLDSESRLRATGGTGGHNHGTPSTSSGAGPAKATPQDPAKDPHAGHRE